MKTQRNLRDYARISTRKLLQNLPLFILLTVFIISLTRKKEVKYVIYYEPFNEKDISCHDTKVTDDLPFADSWKFNPGRRSIFFIETSCKGGLNSRQSCSIEAAAFHNPGFKVYVLFAGPISQHFRGSDTFAILNSITNVKLMRIRLNKIVEHTPLKGVISAALNRSRWGIQHSSDFLRFISLFKFGGIYLDLDVLTVRSFRSLPPNWISKENPSFIGSAALGMTRGRVGRAFTLECLLELKHNFKPDLWLHNGPSLITRVMNKFCGTKEVVNMSSKICRGINVLPRSAFYPIHWTRYYRLFLPGQHVPLNDTYGYHCWNKRSSVVHINNGSMISNLAKRNCPKISEMYGEEFGV